MQPIRAINLGGLDLYTNPLARQRGTFTHLLNMVSDPYGAKVRRPGYITYLGTPDTAKVNSLFSWTKDDGTTQFTYRASGSALYHSVQGTGAWTLSGNGTITNGNHVGYAVLGNTLIVGDGAGSTRHTTNGTSFTNTTLAPISEHFAQYQNRIYAAGTASTLFYSTTGDATNWNTSGTSDSSSLTIPDAGKNSKIFVCADRLNAVKNSGRMFKWDGRDLTDTSISTGPSSPYSIASRDGFFMFTNRLGHYGYGGGRPELLSNAIQREFYNSSGSAVAGTALDSNPAEMFRYQYITSMGTLTEDYRGYTINDAIALFDFQKSHYYNFQFANFPTAYHSYKDVVTGDDVLIFGDGNGQCYKYGGTAVSDNGSSFQSVMELFDDYDTPELEKDWRWFFGFFNPGCQAQVQIATSNYFAKGELKWRDLGDVSSGVAEFRFPDDASRGRFLYLRIRDNSKNSRFSFYGYVCQADAIPIK